MSDYELEYEHLKKEADDDKRYIFERPVLILTLSIAAINFGAVVYVPYIPAFITSILCFNLLFTVNRLLSATRITAYIILVIERNRQPYIGWENVQLAYRELVNRLGEKRITQKINEELDRLQIPKRSGFYPIIYWFHIFVFFVTYTSFLFHDERPSGLVIIFSLASCIWFGYLLVIYNNKKFRRRLIEENLILSWVLSYIADKDFLRELSGENKNG